MNGQAITEDYLLKDDPGPNGPAKMPFDTTVPDGSVYLLGDWRGNAVDSRLFGSVPLSDVRGTVVAKFSLLGGAKPLASTVDRLPVFAWWAAVVGLVWSVLAFAWVAVTGFRRASLS